jgi:hypothetical protein
MSRIPRESRLLLWLGLCVACGTPAALKKAEAPSPSQSAAPRTIQLCADLRMTARGQLCIAPITAEQQRNRSFTARLELEGGLVVRFVRLNGRGPEPDDDGCIEYRYRYEAGYVAESIGYRQDGTVCDRSLWTDRAKRLSLVDEWGRPDFKRERVHTGMLFEHDENGMVIRQQPLGADGAPVTLGLSSEVRYERDAMRLEKRACYFDAQGKAIKNAAGVHCWSYERDRFGNDVVQQAWDEQGKAAATGDGTHRIVKDFDRHGNLLRRSSFGVDGSPVGLETAHCPTIVYHRDDFGFMTGADCRDGKDRAARFEDGHSYWRSSPDAQGRPREVRYFDDHGNLMTTDLGYAKVELERDALGHVVERRFFGADGSPGQKDGPPVFRYTWDARHLEVGRSNLDPRGRPWRNKGCVSIDTEYDQYRQAVRQTCRDEHGKPALSTDNVCMTQWRYDPRGLLIETRYLDTGGKAIDARRGYAKKLLNYDARGLESRSRHFKADGTELELPRYSVLWVRPPLSDEFWPATSRARALAEIEAAQRDLVAGLPWQAALTRYGDEKVYAAVLGDSGYLNLQTLWPALRAVLEPLKVGQYSRVVEIPYGLAIYLRTE